MKILLVSSTFPPRKFGGITKSSYQLAKGLAELGHDVTVFTTDVNDEKTRIPSNNQGSIYDGIKVFYFRNLSNKLAFNRIYLPLKMKKKMKKEIKNFDIVHINDYRCYQSILVNRYCKKYDVPYIVQARGSLPVMMGNKFFKRVFDRIWGYRFLKQASKVIPLSKFEAEQYKQMGVNEDNIEIIPNAIRFAEYEKLPKKGLFRKKYGIDSDKYIILFLARINEIKGVELLTKSFLILRNKIKNVKLVFVGPDDGYMGQLKSLIKNLKLENDVLFTGLLYDEDKLEAYVDSDIYVLPSKYEIFGNTIVEACACGTPVVVTETCAIADLVNNRVGLSVPYDEKKLAEAIEILLIDEKLRNKFGQNGRKMIEDEFDIHLINKKIESLYKKVINNKSCYYE